jgi:hypothetical protein
MLTQFGFNETGSKLAVELTMPFLNFIVAKLWVFRAANPK